MAGKMENITPLSIRGGGIHGIVYHPPVASAQVKSSILLAGLQAKGSPLLWSLESRDHTERMIRQFGGKWKSKGWLYLFQVDKN